MSKIPPSPAKKPPFPAALSNKAATAKMGALMSQRIAKPKKATGQTNRGSKKM